MSPIRLFLRMLSLLWALVVCPLALLLLVSCATRQGTLFAIGALLLGLAPILFFARPGSRRLRTAAGLAFAFWLLITSWLFHAAPNGRSSPGARVQNRSVGNTWHPQRYALGTLLPEVDQSLDSN